MAADLVERDEALATLARAWSAVASGGGGIALVAGEAGIGKTSVLRAFARTLNPSAVWWGACDALQTPHPLAPLLDIARERQPRFAAALADPRPALFSAVLDDLRLTAEPLLVVIEDAHWADDATLDLLKFLGRRIEGTRALLAISWRDDEVGPTHPLRRVLGELPPAARSTVPLQRLSADAVAELARRLGVRAEGVHRASGGNAFFATEMLRDVPRGDVPRTVQDVVLARYARLAAPVQSLLRLASVVPGRIERWLVDDLLSPTVDEVEAALDSGLLVSVGAALAYRHELGRVAIESSLSAPAARALHARVLAALTERGSAAARLVHHATGADDQAAISRHAPAAAREASARGALREATAQWRIALQLGRPADDRELCAWLEAFGIAAPFAGELQESLSAFERLQAVARSRGDTEQVATALARSAVPLVGMLRHRDAVAACRAALALAERLPPSPAQALVWSFECWQSMLERDHDRSVHWGRRALELARSLNEPAIVERTELGLGAALLFTDHAAGRAMLLGLRDRREADGNLVGVAGALSMLGSGSGELMHLVEAEGYLRQSVALYRSQDASPYYAQSWLSLCCLLRGRWDEAAALASEVIADAGDDSMSRLMALLCLARLRLRRGDPGADDALAQARALADGSGTLQRIAPTACVGAEAAFVRGDRAAVVAEVSQALPLAQSKVHPWFLGELNAWLWRAGALNTVPDGCASAHALEIAGHWREAADAWAALDCPYERARALAAGDLAAQREALDVFETLGARPAADAVRQRLHDAGVRGLARGPRASTLAHPFGLTTRELEVLRLLCEGLRNAEIAARVHRSVRTVDHHLAAVFAKLGVDSRVAAIQAAQRAGLVAQSGQSPVPI